MIDAVILVIVIFIISLLIYAMFVSLSSLITQLKRDVQSIIYGVEERLMVEILWDRDTLRNIEEKIDKLNIKAIEEKEVDIKKGDEIVDENNDFYFVTYVYGDKVDGISKNGIVREGMEIGKVKKTGKHGMVRIDTTVDEELEWIWWEMGRSGEK